MTNKDHTMEFTPITGPALQRLSATLKRPVGNAEFCPLPFYTEGDFLRVDGRPYIAAGDGPVTASKLFELTGYGAAIHDANRIAGLSITDDTVVEYLTFFALHVSTEDGNFFVFPEDKEVDGRMVKGPVVKKKQDDYLIECVVAHADQLWNCTYLVSREGDVEMVFGDPADVQALPRVH
jgi:hypothetical protein